MNHFLAYVFLTKLGGDILEIQTSLDHARKAAKRRKGRFYIDDWDCRNKRELMETVYWCERYTKGGGLMLLNKAMANGLISYDEYQQALPAREESFLLSRKETTYD